MEAHLKQQIYSVIGAIPSGKVCAYGQVANLAGMPGYARQVGFLLKNLPNDSCLPWHRVINSAGKLSFPIGSEKYQQQKTDLPLNN